MNLKNYNSVLNITLFCLTNLKFFEHKNHILYLTYLSCCPFCRPLDSVARGDDTTPTPPATPLILIEHIYMITVTCQPSKCHKIQSKVNEMGTFHLSSWFGSNLQQTKRLLSRSDRQRDRRTDGRMDVIKLLCVHFRNSVKMDFACCSFDAVFWPNVDALHLPFLHHISPFLSSTILRCDNVRTETLIT